MQLLYPPLGARKHLIKSRFYHRKIPLAPLSSCLFTTTPASSRAQFSSNKSTWLSLIKKNELSFLCHFSTRLWVPENTQRAHSPQVKYRSPLYRRHTPTPHYFAVLVILFLFVTSQFPIFSWGYCGRHTQPSAQEHGDISAQCARHCLTSCLVRASPAAFCQTAISAFSYFRHSRVRRF
jgi:hypothetical protein